MVKWLIKMIKGGYWRGRGRGRTDVRGGGARLGKSGRSARATGTEIFVEEVA